MKCFWAVGIGSLMAMLFIAQPDRAMAQEKSVRPGINEPFLDPDVAGFIERFEVESREIFNHRDAILKACRIERSSTIADVGAGTGLFTRMFSDQVGPDGTVIAVDIAQKFLDHIDKTCRESKRTNVITRRCTPDSCELQENSVDVAFVCDTYHHFEFPAKTLASIHRALKPNGRLIVVELHRIEGVSTAWALQHVRANKETFQKEIQQAGFKTTREDTETLKENYLIEFSKSDAK